MNERFLSSPTESAQLIADVLERGDHAGTLEVREDKCFKPDQWLTLGRIQLFPGEEGYEEPSDLIEKAVRLGGYQWELPSFEEIVKACNTAFLNDKNSQSDKTRRALETILHTALRCGFCLPNFDAASICSMPFSRPTTVVVDTSGILQGGLDFVVKHLYPMARIKIPAIVNMEILNLSDRYMKQRRSQPDKLNCPSILLDHVTSQGSQRVVLRTELHSEIEIERPRLGADPLRGIITNESDAEDKRLGLQVIQRSFADRLILETAIHHRDRLSSDHPIMILTADQGLARMALAEGIQPLFFIPPPVAEICDRTQLGTTFKPFISSSLEAVCSYIPLADLLWEMACTCGSARLVSDDKKSILEVSAMGESLSWLPFHSKSDLLWVSATTPILDSARRIADTEPDLQVMPRPDTAEKARSAGQSLTGAYRFSVERVLQLILSFENRDEIPDTSAMAQLGLSSEGRYADVRNFLAAADLAYRQDLKLIKRNSMDSLVDAIKSLNYASMLSHFQKVVSFDQFIRSLKVGEPLSNPSEFGIAQSAVPTYKDLAEVCCVALSIFGAGIVATPHIPAAHEFSRLAIGTYQRLRSGEDYVLTGKWIEELALEHGIHPVTVRSLLNEARTAGYLERYTEGSTPETQFERHNMAIVEIIKGKPVFRRQNLYHGDFLIPGKASVSIRLEAKE